MVIGEIGGKETERLFYIVLIERMWKMQYFRDLKFISKDCLRFALLSNNFFLIDHQLYIKAARGK